MQEYQQWLALKAKIKTLTEELHDVEATLWLAANERGDVSPKGSKTSVVDGFKITITHNDSVKVSQKIAAERPELFKLKYEFDKTNYKNLVKSQRDFVDEAICITPMKPSFKIVREDDDN